MKIICSIYVANRTLPNTVSIKGRKHVKSTLALCKHPKSGEYCIILFTSQNQTGTKYAIKNNIQQVLTKFASEGKCTVQFKNPQHDLFIICDPIQLKAFLHFFKRVLENKVSDKELTTSSLSVTAIRPKDMPVVKLTILKRSDYPIKGFPKTLEELHINSIDRCGVDKGIFSLTRLKILDLSNNLIERIPQELNTLPNLGELYLSHNLLGKGKSWDWIGGNLSNTLHTLDLSHNELQFVPREIIRLQQLRSLNFNYNLLQCLTPGIGKLRNLRVFSASNNGLYTLPGTMRGMNLLSIDVSHNNFLQYGHHRPATSAGPLQVCTLKEYAARRVLGARIPYPPGSLPFTVINYLDSANFCVCGKAVFDIYVQITHNFMLTAIAESISTSVGEKLYVPVDTFFCSSRCYRNTFRSRNQRNPIVR